MDSADKTLAVFENYKIRRIYDEKTSRSVIAGESFLPPARKKKY